MIDIASKFTVTGIDDSICYDGDQIAFLIGYDNKVCLSISTEDLENAEMSNEKMKEIRDHKDEIIAHIRALGYDIVEGLEDDEDDYEE